MFPRSINAVIKVEFSFFFLLQLSNIPFGLLPYFGDAVNTGVLKFIGISVSGFFLDKFPEVELLGNKVVSFLIFQGISVMLSTVAAPI